MGGCKENYLYQEHACGGHCICSNALSLEAVPRPRHRGSVTPHQSGATPGSCWCGCSGTSAAGRDCRQGNSRAARDLHAGYRCDRGEQGWKVQSQGLVATMVLVNGQAKAENGGKTPSTMWHTCPSTTLKPLLYVAGLTWKGVHRQCGLAQRAPAQSAGWVEGQWKVGPGAGSSAAAAARL